MTNLKMYSFLLLILYYVSWNEYIYPNTVAFEHVV